MLDVSVVIPTYNRAGVLPRALDSVLAQSAPAREIIVVDDGSSDDTVAMLARDYPTVRCLATDHRGVSAARNTGVRASRGRWIALLDSDDLWLPDKLALQHAAATRVGARRLVHCDESWLRRGKPLAQRRYHRKGGGRVFIRSLARCVISPSAAFMDRALFARYGEFDETMPACEDYDLWLRITAFEAVDFVPSALVVKHGGHADQLSRTQPVLDRQRVRALTKLLDGPPLRRRQIAAVRTMLRQKIDIVRGGAMRRGHGIEVNALDALQRRYCA